MSTSTFTSADLNYGLIYYLISRARAAVTELQRRTTSDDAEYMRRWWNRMQIELVTLVRVLANHN
jgi:hypothetical protein